MSRKRTVKKSRKDHFEYESGFYSKYCFICDEDVEDNGIQIILGRTPYSNVCLPTKIGQLIGDDFMVVVGVSDTICSRCASLISQLDKLETDACGVKKTLMGYISAKYQLNHNEICAKIDQTGAAMELQQSPANIPSSEKVQQTSRKKSQLVSILVSNNKRSKVKNINCANCNFTTTNEDAFQVHTSLCLKQVNQCLQCGALLSNMTDDMSELFSYAATCKDCNLSFDDEETYSKHMESHIVNLSRCVLCNYSSEKDSLLHHIFSHGMQIFQCSLCQQAFHLKTEFRDHMMSHMDGDRCLKCSIKFCSQERHFTNAEISLPSSEDVYSTNGTSEISPREKNMSDYVESLIRVDGFETDGSNIEFYPCPSCGLTFLNKMLFNEHMKMHVVNQNEVGINDVHAEVFKNTDESITGDCSIDDDLEDLFEKLHAETTNSLVSDQSTLEKSSCLQDQAVNYKNRSHEVNFEEPMKGEVISLCATGSTGSGHGIHQVTSGVIHESDQMTSNISHVLMKSGAESVAFNNFDSSQPEEVKISDNQGSVREELDPNEAQTFIYITNNIESLTDGDSQADMVLHSATIDPDGGNIQLLPYIMNDVPPSTELQSPATSINFSDSKGTAYFQHDFSQVKLGTDSKEDHVSPVNCDSLSCNFCSFQTPIPLVLQRHLKIHQISSVLKCSLCNKVFSSLSRLLSHIESRHKTCDSIKCPLCEDEFVRGQLRKHVGDKHQAIKQNFSCRFCLRQYTSRKACASHEENHSEIFRFLCKLCSKKFASEEDLDDHVKWDHEKYGQCRYCEKKIDKPKALKNHESRHMQESNHHECPECKRVFKTKTGLRHHLATHTGQFKYCCDFCGRGFMSRMMLEEHRSCHTKEERYICDICGKKFTFQSTYWIHRKWHDTPYPYKCNYCGRLFKHSSLLAVHKRKHTGERPYKCPHCPLTFPVSGTLKRHIILHTGVYPFNCTSCKRGFTARHKYVLHMEKVHGIKEPVTSKIIQGDPEGITNSLSGNILSERVKEWELDDIDLSEGGSIQILNLAEEPICSRDPLIGDQFTTSRVVEIVLDDSYQPVATVTLGEPESTMSESWCG